MTPTGVNQIMARPERFELPTARFVAGYSIQLSYGRAVLTLYHPSASGEIIPGILPSTLRVRCASAVSFEIRSRRICRTPDRPVRSRVLYPAELRARCFNSVFPRSARGFARGANYPRETPCCQPFRAYISHDIMRLSEPTLNESHRNSGICYK